MHHTVCVQGLGFVGAAMAVAVAAARDAEGRPRFRVIGVDQPTPMGNQRVSALARGEFPFATNDARLERATADAHVAGNLLATTDASAFAQGDTIIIDVHMDVDWDLNPPSAKFESFRSAIRSVGAHARPGVLVIVETTVPPGTCERVVVPELEQCLRVRGLPPESLLVAHSYERVMPGEHYLASIVEFWRVYAGHTEQAADVCEAFLSKVIDIAKYPLTRLSSMTASETAKILENSYRATNIAFIEEWARFAESIGLNLFEIIDAIRVRPTHSNMRQPGFGVGGYCLTKDPLFGGVSARDIYGRPDLIFAFSERAVSVNNDMPLVSLRRLEALLGGSVRGRRILLAGVAYRPDVADTRYSPSQTFAAAAQQRGAVIIPQDPLVRAWPELDMEVAAAFPTPGTVDAVVFALPHKEYAAMDLSAWLAGHKPAILDANHVLSAVQRRAVVTAGCAFAAVGEG